MNKFYVRKVTKKCLSSKSTEVLNMRIQDFIKNNWTDGRIPKEFKDGEIYTLRGVDAGYIEIRLETMYDLITLENVLEFRRIRNRSNKPTRSGIGDCSRKKLNKLLEPYKLRFGMKIEKEDG